MVQAERGQVNRSAAEVYEEFFVPALFGEGATRVVAEAGVESGQRVLDVGCGTGALARQAYARVGPAGSVIGLDPNEGMLEVARRKEPAIDWRRGAAEALPFEDDGFDAVVSQFALMFFEDPSGAIREMARVARPGGRIAVAVWDRIEKSPGYAALVEVLEDLFGERAAAALRAPFASGDPERLRSLFAAAGLPAAEIRTHTGTARFPSLRSWMHTEVRGWTLSEEIDDGRFEDLLAEAEKRLTGFVEGEEGRVMFDISGHIVVAGA